MKTALLTTALLAAGLGTAALAWEGGPAGGHQPGPEWAQALPPDGAAGTVAQPPGAGPQAFDAHGPGGRDRHRGGDGFLGDLLGSLFFFGLFSR